MKITRRHLLAAAPVLPSNLVMAAPTLQILDHERRYLAKIIETAFGKLSEQHIVNAFVDSAMSDSTTVEKLTKISQYSATEVDEIESRIAESFILETNYLDWKDGKQATLKLRDTFKVDESIAEFGIDDPAFWTRS